MGIRMKLWGKPKTKRGTSREKALERTIAELRKQLADKDEQIAGEQQEAARLKSRVELLQMENEFHLACRSENLKYVESLTVIHGRNATR